MQPTYASAYKEFATYYKLRYYLIFLKHNISKQSHSAAYRRVLLFILNNFTNKHTLGYNLQILINFQDAQTHRHRTGWTRIRCYVCTSDFDPKSGCPCSRLSWFYSVPPRSQDNASQYGEYGTGWLTEKSWFDSRQGQKFVFKNVRTALEPKQPPIQCVLCALYYG